MRVDVAEELKQAIDGGAAHVHITQHLDLRSLPLALPPPNCTGDCEAKTLFWGPSKLQSLTVRSSVPYYVPVHKQPSLCFTTCQDLCGVLRVICGAC